MDNIVYLGYGFTLSDRGLIDKIDIPKVAQEQDYVD